MKTDLISIIIPVYNRPTLVAEAIDSVLAQTNPNWELIVVDDGSKDNTWEVLESYAVKDERIRIFKRDREPKGAPVCRNIGMENSTGKYLIFLDSDDLLAPWAIVNRLKYVCGSGDFDMLIFNGLEFDNSNIYLRKERAIFGVRNLLDYHINYQAAWQTTCALWNKSFFKKTGGWHEYSQSSQDSVLHLIALYNGAIVKWGDEIPDLFIRVEKGFEKISNKNSIEKIKSRINTLLYVKSKLKAEDFSVYSYFFVLDLINRLEYLDNKSLLVAIRKEIPEIESFGHTRRLAFYFKLYTYSRSIRLLHGLVYRLRYFITKLPRLKNIRENSFIKDEIFDRLIERAKDYPSIQNKVKVLRNDSLSIGDCS